MKKRKYTFIVLCLLIMTSFIFSDLYAIEVKQSDLVTNNMGIWIIGYFVDEFGDKTNVKYITNSNWIKGTFSNTATQNSLLNVKLLISNETYISIQLYEYARDNPVKAISSDLYRTLIKDREGDEYVFYATNTSDRISFDGNQAKQIHNILLKGGKIKFRIYKYDTPTTQYSFTINDAGGYEKAFKKLIE